MTSEHETRPERLSEDALRDLISVALEKGYYRESLHAESDHPERNISAEDVIFGLERSDWRLLREPDYDQEHSSWEYLIETKDIEGDKLCVKVAAFPNLRRFEIISRW